MYNKRYLLFVLSFCASVCAEPLADSLGVLGESLKTLAGLLPEVEPRDGEPDFLVWEEFEYADPAPGAPKPIIKIGLVKGYNDLVVYGPILKDMAVRTPPAGQDFIKDRTAPVERQKFVYLGNLINDLVNFTMNDAEQVIERPGLSRRTYILQPGNLRGPVPQDTALGKLYDAFLLKLRGAAALDINKWWVKYGKAAEEADFSIYKEFDYADGERGRVAQPKLKIGLAKASDELIVYGPKLEKVEKNIFRDPAGLEQSFRYPVQATKMKWNAAGQIVDEGPKQIYVVEDQPTPGLATKGAAKKLTEAFIEWKNSGKDFNIQDWWTKSAAPKKEVENVQPKFSPASTQNIAIADAGGIPAANTEITIGLVPSAEGKFDLVVWGPMLTGARPQDFDKGYASLEYPVEKTIKIQWSSPKQIKNMGPFSAFTLVSSKEFAAKQELGKLFIEKIEKKKPIFDAEFAALKSQVDEVLKLRPISKSNVAQFQDAANKLVDFFNKEAAELMPLLSDRNGPNTPAWAPLGVMAQGLESLYRLFGAQIKKDQKSYADALAGMSVAAQNAQKIAAEKGTDNQWFKNEALKNIVSLLQKNSDKQTDFAVKTMKIPLLTALETISGLPINKAPSTAKLFWKKSIQPKSKAPGVDPDVWDPDKEDEDEDED